MKYCVERHSHTSCSLAFTDSDSMSQARLDFSIHWQLIYIPRTLSLWPHCCGYLLKLTSEELQEAGVPTFAAGALLWPSLFRGNISHQVIFRKTSNSLPVKELKNKHVEEANYFPAWKVLTFCTQGCRIRILFLPKGCSALGLGSPVQEIWT